MIFTTGNILLIGAVLLMAGILIQKPGLVTARRYYYRLFVHVYTFILVHNCKHCRTRVTFLEKCSCL